MWVPVASLQQVCVTGVEAGSARREFLAYCLSLLRAHSAEHAEQLPVLDVAALKHVAYVLDALVYYMRAAQPQPHHHPPVWTAVCIFIPNRQKYFFIRQCCYLCIYHLMLHITNCISLLKVDKSVAKFIFIFFSIC